MSAITAWGLSIAATAPKKSDASPVRRTHPAPVRPTEVFSFHETYPTVVSDNKDDS